MNEQELKALQAEIKAEQKKQTDAIELLKKDVGTQNTKLAEDYNKSADLIQKLSVQADALALQLKDQKMGRKIVSPWDDMKKVMTDKKVITELKNGGQRTFEIKQGSDMTEDPNLSAATLDTSVIIPFRELGVGKAADRRTTLLDRISRANMTSNIVTWVERGLRTDETDTVAEGVAAVQSDLTWIMKQSPAIKVGTYIKVSNEAFEDWDQILAEIQLELFPMVERFVEQGCYDGGGAPDLTGIITVADTFWHTGLNGLIISPNQMDCIRACVMQLANNNYYATDVFMNPADTAAMDLAKNADGVYLLPPFITADRKLISGVRVNENNYVDLGDLMIGDLTKDVLFMKRGIEIKIWDQNEDDAIADMKTITAFTRCVNRIKTPDLTGDPAGTGTGTINAAFIYSDFATIIAAIEV